MINYLYTVQYSCEWATGIINPFLREVIHMDNSVLTLLFQAGLFLLTLLTLIVLLIDKISKK